MNRRRKGEWIGHSNFYTSEDISMFNNLLPELLSNPARKTSWAKKEHLEMMERFKKSFGGAPLNLNDRI